MSTKKLFFILMLTIILAVLAISTALAAAGPPVGGCPAQWELHSFMDHEEHEEHHVGLTVDLNGDGNICVLHAISGKHVHMDNVLP